jgi:uridylate kinase
MYKRVLLKLSGEQLQGRFEGGGFDAELAKWIARQVKEATDAGAQVIIMVGGGNYARGAQLAGNGIGRVTADNIGMLATLMNALSLTDVFNDQGVPARALTNVQSDQVADQFTHRRAVHNLDDGKVVIVAGGVGRPYLTTDTAAVSLALELECDAILKATKVDGVYDKDPEKHSDAVKLKEVSYHEALSNGKIKVMDKAAIGLAMEHDQTVIIFDLLTDGNIALAVSGEKVGTKVA